MLYKKYHRNFVSHFKKGVRFRFSFYKKKEMVYKVNVEPYYDETFCRRNIRITGSNTEGVYDLVLVFTEGRLADMKYNIEEDVI